MQYQQPDFYKFNEDSTRLARWASQFLVNDDLRIADLGAGSGVIGIELALARAPQVKEVVFNELQENFLPFLRSNCSGLLGEIPYSIHTGDFSLMVEEEIFRKSFHAVIFNPPYFSLGSGRGPLDEKRKKARFYEDGYFLQLLKVLKAILHPQGEFFFCWPERNFGKWKEEGLQLKIESIRSNLFFFRGQLLDSQRS